LGYLKTLSEKTVVICHHLHILHQLEGGLKQAGRNVVVHSGKYASPTAAVKQFQTDPTVQFFVEQVMASSLSLTLIVAHHVVFAELPQTRADFEQAVDRVHRIGQQDDVLVTVFAVEYLSNDRYLLDYMREKKAVSEQILDLKEPDDQSGWNWRQRYGWMDNQLVSPNDFEYAKRRDAWKAQLHERMLAGIAAFFGMVVDLDESSLTPRQEAKRTIHLLLKKLDDKSTPREEIPKIRYAIRQLMKQFEITKMEILRVVT
jgi:hypothetical protein